MSPPAVVPVTDAEDSELLIFTILSALPTSPPEILPCAAITEPVVYEFKIAMPVESECPISPPVELFFPVTIPSKLLLSICPLP